MKATAIFAAIIPWIVFAGAILSQRSGVTGDDSIGNAGLLWLFMSPLWFAAGCLVSYRHGQWSIK